MSSNEEDYNDPDNTSQSSKKRKVQRACDTCRRKKIRCDGGQMPGNRCSNCIAYSFDCTYIEAAKKRGPPKGYVERLESRLEKLEKVLNRLCPDSEVLKELEPSLETDWLTDRGPKTTDSTEQDGHQPRNPCDIATMVIRRAGGNPDLPEDLQDDDFAHVLLLSDNFKRLTVVDDTDKDRRYFGKSSGAMFLQTALEVKNQYTGGNEDIRRQVLGSKRPEFWTISSWEQTAQPDQKPTYIFPEEDLMLSLIDLYFEHTNLYLPLLHRPTFDKAVAAGLHLRDDSFGATLLLVCANGSRNSDDPRILADGVDSYHSAGWKWFNQVHLLKNSLLSPPSLYDLQFYSLSVIFLQASSAPQSCWTMVGIGIRLAQDVGAHRRKYDRKNMTAEDEMWKRAFWVLVCMDRMVSSSLGRPCAIQDEDFDVDFPVECDDEYWDNPDPAQRFKQPPNKPSIITAFNLYLKLLQVLAIVLRTIYSINKSKILLGFVGQQWEQHIVAELDSALNKWVDTVPDFLRWDPTREDMRFFTLSATIYCTYYHIQILIHRPFIPSPRKPSPLTFPSLAICTNAARSCSHIVDVQRRRGILAPPQVQIAIFTSGIVLLLSLWGGKRSGLATDTSREMADVQKCMQALKGCETRWHSAGRLWDILCELACVGDLPLPKPSPPVSNKRERGADSPLTSSTNATNSPSSTAPDTPRTIAGTRRVTRESASGSSSGGKKPPLHHERSNRSLLSAEQQPTPFSLPVYSEELGRFPPRVQAPRGQASPFDASMSYWHSGSLQSPESLPSTSTAPSPAFSHPGAHSIGSSIPMEGLKFDQMGMHYPNMFPQSSSASPSLSVMQSPFEHGELGTAMHSLSGGAGVNPQQTPAPFSPGQFGAGGVDANMQALIDSDTFAMWSNAPTGLECVISCTPFSRDSYDMDPPGRLDDWGTYLANVSELTHGFHHPSGAPGDQQH
ncbi:Activator of stress genes 1 [Hypsizygus marmoreus]|uniref:Activator of stress genes 1 n=1 Tax=Hypsizygus marmoreus TaxID=39966 RepID=A0A369K2B0_HYPMA|nr:Activator of stress genes 1 [Hypsizygus marmoreus]